MESRTLVNYSLYNLSFCESTIYQQITQWVIHKSFKFHSNPSCKQQINFYSVAIWKFFNFVSSHHDHLYPHRYSKCILSLNPQTFLLPLIADMFCVDQLVLNPLLLSKSCLTSILGLLNLVLTHTNIAKTHLQAAYNPLIHCVFNKWIVCLCGTRSSTCHLFDPISIDSLRIGSLVPLFNFLLFF